MADGGAAMNDLLPGALQHEPQRRPRTLPNNIISKIRSVFGETSTQNLDPELGTDHAPIRAVPAPPGYPGLATFVNTDVDHKIIRRFGYLHARVLLERQNEIADLEKSLQGLDGQELDGQELDRGDYRDSSLKYRQESRSCDARLALLKTIEEKLSEYQSLILRVDSVSRVRQDSKTGKNNYESIRDWLDYGPSMEMDRSDLATLDKHEWMRGWAGYESAVNDILKDPKTTSWLDGLIEDVLGRILYRQLVEPNRKEAENTSWTYEAKKRLRHVAIGGGILFWILHTTAALAFVLIANTFGYNGHYMVNSLFGWWYVSTISIVVLEFLSKGYVYARKVLLGGMLACIGGFYTLNVLLSIPIASALTATPIFITIVLLLIRTM